MLTSSLHPQSHRLWVNEARGILASGRQHMEGSIGREKPTPSSTVHIPGRSAESCQKFLPSHFLWVLLLILRDKAPVAPPPHIAPRWVERTCP